ncbi:MAG: metalloregulator ArsR/SmtB family transcription factor [Bacteroidia bacterium]|nr:metalloregulator ArsR/SmtB family transcription factor [Bacteroidia bacterium]
MAKSKRSLFSDKDSETAEIAKSLGHPARVQILKLLLMKSPQNCSEIVEQIPLAQATVSQHLSELKHSGMITDKREANMVLYSANKERVVNAFNLFNDLLLGHVKNVKQQKLF